VATGEITSKISEEVYGRRTGSITGEETNEIRRRNGWQIIGLPPF
jgi:hypothetical protein